MNLKLETKITMNIIIIEDVKPAARLLQRKVEKLGLQVNTMLHSVEEAIAWFQNNAHPDLIFLDVMMPKKNGYEVCREIKQDPDIQQIYVIILTARGVELPEDEKKKVNANEYMSKPFSPIKVVERVNAIFAA